MRHNPVWVFRRQVLWAIAWIMGYAILVPGTTDMMVKNGPPLFIYLDGLTSLMVLVATPIFLIPTAEATRLVIDSFLGRGLFPRRQIVCFYIVIFLLLGLWVQGIWFSTFGSTGPLAFDPLLYFGSTGAVFAYAIFLDLRIARLKKSISSAPWTARPR